MKDLRFEVFWSVEDGEWVAVCDQFRSLSVLQQSPAEALIGLLELIEDEIDRMASADVDGGES